MKKQNNILAHIANNKFKYLLLLLLFVAVILEFFTLFKFEIRESSGGFIEKLYTYLNSSILLLLFAMLGIIQVVEYVIGFKNEIAKRIAAGITFVIFIIFLILVYSVSCSKCYGEEIQSTSRSIIADYSMMEKNYKLNISDFNHKSYYYKKDKDSNLSVIQSISLLNELYTNDFDRKKIFVGGSKLEEKLNDLSRRLDQINEAINSTEDIVLKLKLSNFKYVFGLVLVDCYLRNYKDTSALNSNYQFNFNKYYDKFYADITGVEIESNTLPDSIKNLYVGSLLNIEGILFSLHNQPKDYFQIKLMVAKKIEDMFDAYVQVPDTLIKLEQDSLTCQRAIDNVNKWIKLVDENNQNLLTSTSVSLDNATCNLLGLNQPLSILLTDPQIKERLLPLKSKLAEVDSSTNVLLKTERTSFNSYKSNQYQRRQKFLKSLFDGDINFDAFREILANNPNYSQSSVNNNFIESELSILETKVDSMRTSATKLDSLYNVCKLTFDKSFALFEKLDLTSQNNYKGYILSCMPKINYAITGMNWGLKKEIDENEVPEKLREYYKSEMEKFANIYNLKKSTRIDSLARAIENSRIYFRYSSITPVRNGEKALSELVLKMQMLQNMVPDSTQKIIIKINGHNGASEEIFRTQLAENSEVLLKLYACDRAIRRAEYVANYLSSNFNSDRITYVSRSSQKFNSLVQEYKSSQNTTPELQEILNEVRPFEIIEQSVTFKIELAQ